MFAFPTPPWLPSQRMGRALRGLVGAGVAVLATALQAQPPAPLASADWSRQLTREIEAIALPRGTELGVHVRDLATGAVVNVRAQERWYLASLVKLPVAIAVLRGVEQGQFTLDTTLRLRADDRVDGAGHTNAQPVASALTVRWLLEEMMAYSDNTASDMLIGLVGLDAVNAAVASLEPAGFERITTLGDVRRQVYGQLTPAAGRLRGAELLHLHALPSDGARLQWLSQLLEVPVAQFRRPTLQAAYEAYYRSGANSARLEAYGGLVAALAEGRALGPEQTAWLLALMERTRTGAQRIKAGLPPEARWAHKTGTQRERTCDAGVLRAAGRPHREGLVVVACVRGPAPRREAEAALRDVGLALCRSRPFARSSHDVPHCPPSPAPVAGPAAAGLRAAGGGR